MREKTVKNPNKSKRWPVWPAVAFLALALVNEAFAGLPAPALPSGTASSTNWLDVLKGYARDGSAVLTVVLAVGVFILLGYFIVVDLAAVRKGDKEWGDLGLMAVIGAAAFLWVTYLLGQVAGVFT